MTRTTIAAVGVVLLLAACGGTADTTTTSTGPVAAPTTTTAQTPTTTTTIRPTTTTDAGPTCQEFAAAVFALIDRVTDNLELLGTTSGVAAEGSISRGDTSAVFLMLSERFAGIEEDWRAIGPAPPGFELVHDYGLQGIGKFLESSTNAALALSADDAALLDEATFAMGEGTDLISQALDALIVAATDTGRSC